MNQESDDLPLNTPANERGYDPAPRPSLSPQDERLARLRELRRQRERLGTGPLSPEALRRGPPTPPPAQPPLQEMLKHWWQHGPFSGRLPPTNPTDPEMRRSDTRPSAPSLPTTATPYEERAKELIEQGRKGLTIASARAKEMMSQARGLLNQKMPSQPKLPSAAPKPPSAAAKPPSAAEVVPGLILVGFAPDIPLEVAIKEIRALGGKPLRHKASLNLFQVAVPPGDELAIMQQLLLRPGVISADLERAKTPRQ
jgi:hypothetical protein